MPGAERGTTLSGATQVPAPFNHDDDAHDDDAWEADLAAWDAAIPVVARGTGSRSGPATAGSSGPTGVVGAAPEQENPFADTPITLVSHGEVMDIDDLPDLIPSGAFDSGMAPGSGSYAALITTDESAPGIFDAEPVPEPAPPFPPHALPEMGAARWRQDLTGLIELGTAVPAAPTEAYLEGLAALLADERAAERALETGPRRAGERGQDRTAALALAAARVAELRGRWDEARGHIDAALARDGASVAGHRARLLLGERLGQLDDEGVGDSLSRLSLMAHPDQPYYRSLRAEWALARTARGRGDAAAPALITAAPAGIGRLLAEVELSWRQPTVAAALLEAAAQRVGGGLGAALLACAAGLNEAGEEFQTAAQQRSVAAGLDEARAPEAVGRIRDVARLEPGAAVTALEQLLGRWPPSALKVALARWGAAAARRAGDPARAWRFVEDVGNIAPADLPPSTGALLVRDRLDLWAARGPAAGPATFAAVAAPVVAAWPSVTARTCLALHAGARLANEEDRAAFVRSVETLLDEVPDNPALAPALDAVAEGATTPPLRRQALRLVRRIDPARWVPASLELVDSLLESSDAAETPSGSGATGEESPEAVLLELGARAPETLAFWRAAALQAARGDGAAASATLDRGLDPPAWQGPLAAPLAELSAESLAQTDLAGAAARLSAGAPERVPAPTRTPTLERLLRRLRDRGRWAAYVTGGLTAPAGHAVEHADERARRAAQLLEPIFWRAEERSGDASSSVAAALALVPAHPSALGLALGARPQPADLAARMLAGGALAGTAEPGGGPRAALSAAVAATIAGDGAQALALARRSLEQAQAAGVPQRDVIGGAGALVRRLLWAAPGAEARAATLRQLIGDAAVGAATLVEAAESDAAAADDTAPAGAPALFARAREADGAAALAADIEAGLDRLALGGFGPRGTGTRPPERDSNTTTRRLGPSDPRSGDRLATLEEVAMAARWPDIVRALAETPPHELVAGPTTLALAAELDEGRAGGVRAADLWGRATAGYVAAAASSGAAGPDGGAAPAELGALFRAADRPDGGTSGAPLGAGEALERLAEVAAAAPARDTRSSALFLVEAAMRAGAGGSGGAMAAPLGNDAPVNSTAPTAPTAPREIERRLRAAIARDPASAPALLAWRRWLLRAGRVDEAAAAAAAEAEALADPELRVQALLRAAALLGATSGSGPAAWTSVAVPTDAESIEDESDPSSSDITVVDARVDRAAAYLTRALEIVPHDHDAFSRLRTLYEESGRAAALADLLGVRLDATQNPFEVTALRLARTELFAGALGDRPRARAELDAILQKEPHHARALGRLADLEQEDGNHVAAAELLIRQAFMERSPEKLRELFLRLGRIYTQNAPDPKRAIGAYSRVLQLDAGNLEALKELSRLYLGLGENKNAVSMTERLLQLELLPARRSAYHIRLGHLAERGGDMRTAGQHFRRAVDEAPRDIEALGELVRHLEKARDTAGRRALLDRASADLRKGVLAAPGDATLLAAFIAVSRWRGRAATASAAAELGTLTDTADGRLPDWAVPAPGGRRVAAVAKPSVDEQTFGPAVPASVRHLFRLLGPSLWEGGRGDLSRLGVEKNDRIAPGRPPRDIVDAIAAELAAGPFELWVPSARSPSGTEPLLVEPGKPPRIVLGGALVRLGQLEVRFMAARTLRLVTTHLDIAMAGDPVELGAWLTGVIRQYVPEYRHPNVPVELAAARTARVTKLIPRKLKQEAMPFAMECSGALDLAALHTGIRDGANRVGLLGAGSLRAALRVVMAAAGAGLDGRISTAAIKRDAQAMALVSFALSDEYDDLVRALE